jgi:hypothetical protein
MALKLLTAHDANRDLERLRRAALRADQGVPAGSGGPPSRGQAAYDPGDLFQSNHPVTG